VLPIKQINAQLRPGVIIEAVDERTAEKADHQCQHGVQEQRKAEYPASRAPGGDEALL
jgi:hypothetical protein